MYVSPDEAAERVRILNGGDSHQVTSLRRQVEELRGALEIVWRAAIRENAPLHLDSFWDAKRGAWAYLEHAELVQLKQALARTENEGEIDR